MCRIREFFKKNRASKWLVNYSPKGMYAQHAHIFVGYDIEDVLLQFRTDPKFNGFKVHQITLILDEGD